MRQSYLRHDIYRADQLEMRIRVLSKHDAKRIEEDVDTLFRIEPDDKKNLFGLGLHARGPGEKCDVGAVVNIMASPC